MATVGPTLSMITCCRDSDLALQSPRGDLLLRLHEPVPALFLHVVRYRRRQIVRSGASHRLVLEAADAIELGLVEPFEQHLEIRIGLAGKADDESRAQSRDPGRSRASARSAPESFPAPPDACMRFSTSGEACWNGMSR